MPKKKRFFEKIHKTLDSSKVDAWYSENFEGINQTSSLDVLEKAVKAGDLTLSEAFVLAFVTGLQWYTKFEGDN